MAKKTYEKYLEKSDEVSVKEAAPKKKHATDKSYLQYLADEEENVQNQRDAITKDTMRLGAHGASFGFSDEIAGAMSPDYEKGRDEYRKEIEGSRERLPYAGPVIEGMGSAATTALIPGLRAGHWATETGLSALQAYGENTEPENLDKDIAVSMGISGAANATGSVVKKMFDPPETILANSVGARGINYRKGETYIGDELSDDFADRLKDPAALAKRLDGIGFFGMGKKKFEKGKFVRDGLLNSFDAPTLEGQMSRVDYGLDSLKTENDNFLKGKRIPVSKVKAALQQAAADFIPAGEDYAKRADVAQQLVDNGWQDLMLSGALKPGDTSIDATAVEKVLKSNWQKKVAASYDSGKAVSDITNEGVVARRKFSTAIDKLVDSYGGDQYAKNNDMMRDLLTVRNLIHNKSSMQRGYSGSGARLTSAKHFMDSLLENTVYSHGADLARARVGQGMRTPIGKAASVGLSRIPVEAESSLYTDQTPPPVEVIENDPDHPMNQQGKGRMPQSVPNIPEQFIRTPLPRTTEGLMKNKNFVLGKVAQMMPEMFEAVQDTYEHEPEMLGEIAQVLSMKMPHLFERDKYNRFDGRILSEQDKAKAIKDTLLNSNISSIEQAKIITKLNKEGLYDG